MNVGHLLQEARLTNELTDDSRRRLIRAVVRYMQELFGDYPQQNEKIATAKAVVSLFPYLKVKDGQNGGIVSTFVIIFEWILFNLQFLGTSL